MKRLVAVPLVFGLFVALLYWSDGDRVPGSRSAEPAASTATASLSAPARPIPSALASLAEHDLGVASCDQYRRRFAACDKLPVRTREAFLRAFEGYRQAAERADKRGARELWAEATGQRCDRAGRAWQSSLQSLGC